MFFVDLEAEVDKIAFAKRLRYYRIQQGMSQATLAGVLSIGPRTYRNWESGRNVPRLPAAKRLADYFRISVYELLYGKEFDV